MNTMSDTRHQSLVARLLWRIETGLSEPMSLTDLAQAEGVSVFHLTRAFSLALGRSPMAYVRSRRLAEAAQAVRAGATVTDVAFAACFESVEGFSRAFRAEFGVPPSVLRSDPTFPLDLQEPIKMPTDTLEPVTPRIVDFPGQKIVGLSEQFTMSNRGKIPGFWQRAIEETGDLLHDRETFGACSDMDEEGFRYFIGCADDAVTPDGLETLDIPSGRYAVFEHKKRVAQIDQTWTAIFESWMPSAGEKVASGVEFERYEKGFDPETPGGVSIWIPLDG